MKDVYISGVGVFLPNKPINNDEIEETLGRFGNQKSRSKAMVLRNNGIKLRYYAIDPATGKSTHSNRQMAAEAIRTLCREANIAPQDIEVLVCGTAGPDQWLPSHGVMVHAELGNPPCEVVTTSGVCCSGMSAFKYGYMSVASGLTRSAVTTASEVSSMAFRSSLMAPQSDAQLDNLSANPVIGFDAEFLRWMLSDGAAAVLMTDAPGNGEISLRVDWVDIVSMAHRAEPCMYMGADKLPDGTLQSWNSSESLHHAVDRGYFQLKQDVKTLSRFVVPLCTETLSLVRQKRGFKASDFDWFLPHLSSEYFRKHVARYFAEVDFEIPDAKWFTNLSYKGNTGCAAIFIIIEEMMKSGKLSRGQKLLCLVPESARFTYAWMQLTVV